jgi:hypothetical protein
MYFSRANTFYFTRKSPEIMNIGENSGNKPIICLMFFVCHCSQWPVKPPTHVTINVTPEVDTADLSVRTDLVQKFASGELFGGMDP